VRNIPEKEHLQNSVTVVKPAEDRKERKARQRVKGREKGKLKPVLFSNSKVHLQHGFLPSD
jgi:hypothetical protein